MSFTVDEESKKKIITLIHALVPEAQIYLFGSRARGTSSQWSDIDLALDTGKALPRLNVSELNDIMAASNLPYKVDIVDFHAISNTMRQIVDKEKVLWKL